MKKVSISVTNDLTTDQRVDRVCRTLTGMGFEVTLIGRKLKSSLPLSERPYQTKRLNLFFRKGPQFYAEINIRLFLYLLFHKVELLVSNDLDTLPANYLVALTRNLPHVHDCHEYFRGVPELNQRPFTIRIWKWIEDLIFPKLKNIYAVNGSIAEIYQKEYGTVVNVIRNVPVKKEETIPKTKSEIGIPEKNRVILYQGAVNVDRGLEEAISAMKYLSTPATLLILGTGDIVDKLKAQIIKEGLNDKVIMMGVIPMEQLHSFTLVADLGLSIEKDVSLNYHFCLPNKFLDYIQANVPVLISPLPEMKSIVDQYLIGEWIDSHEAVYLAKKIDQLLNNRSQMEIYKRNLVDAANDLCWEKEGKELIKIFQPYA